jgi:plasmid maintenance system killer protein
VIGCKVLELAFETKSIRTICEKQKKAESKLGVNVSNKLKRRLADLIAAPIASDIVAGKPAVEKGNPHERMSVQLGEGFRLVFVANHNQNPTKGGAVDWAKVNRIRIIEIEAEND